MYWLGTVVCNESVVEREGWGGDYTAGVCFDVGWHCELMGEEGGGGENPLEVDFFVSTRVIWVIIESQARLGLQALDGHGVRGGPTQFTGDRRGRGGEGRGGVYSRHARP